MAAVKLVIIEFASDANSTEAVFSETVGWARFFAATIHTTSNSVEFCSLTAWKILVNLRQQCHFAGAESAVYLEYTYA